MERTTALAALDRRILEAFSRDTTGRLRAILLLRVALPRVESFLADNVAKEARKDALVIRHAGGTLGDTRLPEADAVRALLEAAREIDRNFLDRVGHFPVRIAIPYERIEPLRRRRVERLLELSHRILRRWRAGGRLRDEFTHDELRQHLQEILDLYVEETVALEHSVRLPALLVPLRERLAQALRHVMREVAARMASDLAGAVHRRGQATATRGRAGK
jgi:hypothetical protein